MAAVFIGLAAIGFFVFAGAAMGFAVLISPPAGGEAVWANEGAASRAAQAAATIINEVRFFIARSLF